MSKKLFPVLFIGHGSPMNIILDNPYTRDMKEIGPKLPGPRAILVVSAHWLTDSTFVTGSAAPEQIYDFYGFPDSLYKIKYNAPGAIDIAEEVASVARRTEILIDKNRGIDHAAWAVLCHMYPGREIPVLELSIDLSKGPQFHFDLGKELSVLREKEILVIGSGNIVHNLFEIDFEENSEPYPWAIEFDRVVKENLEKGTFENLIGYHSLPSSRKAVPIPDHYYPMLYVLGMKDKDDKLTFVHESIQNASVSMRCFMFGN
jgi:4,5-DOPA dioxygenase extradiol